MTNSLGQASQRQLPLETPQSLGPLHAEFPLVHVGSSVPPCLCTFCSLYRNALLPLPSPGSRSSFKTQFRCLPLREEVHCPLFCIPTAPCPCLGKSTDWGSLTISSARVCLANSPSLLEVRNHWLFISVSGTLLMLLKCLLDECMDDIVTPQIFWHLCCRGLFSGFWHLLTIFSLYS